MKHIFTFIIGIILSTTLFSQGWIWKSHLTGTGTSNAIESTVDNQGNVYVIGQFNGTINQDSYSLDCTGGLDGFIAKYNKNGNLMWLKSISGAGNEQPTNICISNDGSSFYLSVNSTSNPTIFDGTSINTLGVVDICIAKYSTSDGNLIWAHNSVYGSTNQTISKIALDNEDNIILTGIYLNEVTFYGGIVSYSSTSTAFQTFLAKFDSNGNLIWSKNVNTTNNGSYFRSISFDENSYYFTGTYSGTMNLDIETLTNSGNSDIFLYKTDLNGNGIWIRKISGNGTNIVTKNFIDSDGNQFITGYFNSDSLFVDSTATIFSTNNCKNLGNNDILYACYDINGTLQFVKSFGSIDDDKGNGISANQNYVYLGGQYTGIIKFDDFQLDNSYVDAFMIKTDKEGNVVEVNRSYGTNSDIVRLCNAISSESAVFIGDFNSTTLTIDNTTLTNPSTQRDLFLAKFGCFDGASYSHTPVTCVDGGGIPIEDDATATIYPDGGLAPFTYLWSNGQTTQTATGLSLSTYSVTITDANNCTISEEIEITASPILSASISSQINLTCRGTSNGSATAQAINGKAPFTYQWNTVPIQTTQTAINLSAATYRVSITDACGNMSTANVTITEPAALSLSLVGSNPQCSGTATGYATANTTGGTNPYTYLWSNGQTTQTAINLSPNVTYRVTVTDYCGSTITTSIRLSNPANVSVSISNKINPTCFGGNNGSMTANAVNGSLPYTYSWNTTPIQTSQTAVNLSAGVTYRVTVTDGCGRTATSSATLTNPVKVTASIVSVVAVTCRNGSNGKATATGVNGSTPYTYIWPNGQTTATATNLTVGNHRVTVTDACGNTATATATIPNATDITINSSTVCTPSGQCLGSATASPINGTSPYTYRWSSGATTQTANNLCAARYRVTVTDFNGCTKVKTGIRIRTCTAKESDYNNDSNPLNADFNQTVEVYPNPSTDKIQIQNLNADENVEIIIYDISGKIILHEKSLGYSYYDVDISLWDKGLYLIRIISDEEILSEKFIKE